MSQTVFSMKQPPGMCDLWSNPPSGYLRIVGGSVPLRPDGEPTPWMSVCKTNTVPTEVVIIPSFDDGSMVSTDQSSQKYDGTILVGTALALYWSLYVRPSTGKSLR